MIINLSSTLINYFNIKIFYNKHTNCSHALIFRCFTIFFFLHLFQSVQKDFVSYIARENRFNLVINLSYKLVQSYTRTSTNKNNIHASFNLQIINFSSLKRKKLFKEKSQQVSNSATDGTSEPRHNDWHEVGENESFRPPLL